MRRLLIASWVAAAAAVLLLLPPWKVTLQAAVACSSTNWALDIDTTSNQNPITFPTANGSGDLKVLFIYNRTDETHTIDGVSGSVDASGWTLASGPHDFTTGTGRSWVYYRADATAGTETVTVDFSSTDAVSSQLVGGWCTGAATSSPVDAFDDTPAQFNAATNWDSDTLTTSMAGGILGGTFSNNASTYTIDGAGESQLSCGGGGQRLCVFFQAYAASGTEGFELTASGASNGLFEIVAFKEPAGSPGAPGSRTRCLLLGVC